MAETTDARDVTVTSARAFALGVVAGMRSQMPLALLAYQARRGAFAADARPPLSLLRGRAALPILGLFATGELIADKLPTTPSRLLPGPLAGRLVVGAVAGAAVAADARQPALAGSLLGAAGALAGAAAGYHLRAALGRATGLPDPVWAICEDVTALTLGLRAADSSGETMTAARSASASA